MSGWIKLYRQLLDNPIVMKDADHIAVWIYLLLQATHAEYSALFKGARVMLQPGQLITGSASIANRLKINESKVRRILKIFESDGQIERQTSNKNSLISIINWNKYQISDKQSDGQPADNRRTTDGKQGCKRIKESKNIIDIQHPAKPQKHKHGEYNNVLLTDDEYQKLKNEYPDIEERIERLSEYIASTGKKYKSHYATIRAWARKEKGEKNELCRGESSGTEKDNAVENGDSKSWTDGRGLKLV